MSEDLIARLRENAADMAAHGFPIYSRPLSEAAAELEANRKRIAELEEESRALREIISQLGYCTPDASLEFMRLIPGEVAALRTGGNNG